MPLTPLEVRQHLLPIAKIRGYERAETDKFLKRVGIDYEAVWVEREDLKKQVARFELELNELRERDAIAAERLVAVEASAAQIRPAADRAGVLTTQMEAATQELRQAAEREAHLQEHLTRLELDVATYREREAIVAETLIAAEASAAETRSRAREQARELSTQTDLAARERREAAELEAQAIVSEAETMKRQLDEETARARERHEAELEELRRLAEETRQNLSSLLIDTLHRAGVDVERLDALEGSAATPTKAFS